MKHFNVALGAYALACVATACTGAAAQAPTRIGLRQIVIQGDQNVEARWINNHGSIVATLYAGITDAATGVRIDGDKVTTIPAPYAGGGPAHPRVIDDQGDILGWALDAGPDPRLFLIKNGVTQPQYEIIVAHEEGGQNFIIQPVGLARRTEVFGTVIVSYTAPNTAFYGVPPHLRTVPSFDRFQHINSIDKSGTVAGLFFSFGGNTGVFMGKSGDFSSVTPPGATSVAGGYLNDFGTLAGSYRDATGLHGFTLAGGQYKSFDMPEPASAINVTGINASGRVVGVYTAATSKGEQHAFVYNGTTVTGFGRFDTDNTVLVVLNDRGDMVVDDQLYSSEPHFQSFRAKCDGMGC